MPTVLRINDYQFFFVSSDAGEPIHIHVAKQGKLCKIWLATISIAYNHGFKQHELNEIIHIVTQNHARIQEAWNAHFA